MFKNEGYREHPIDSDEQEPREDIYKGLKAPIGLDEYVETDQVIDTSDNEGTRNPLDELLAAEAADEDDEGDEVVNEGELVEKDDWVPLSQYGNHGVATGEEAEKKNIPGSKPSAPRMPRIYWPEIRKDNRSDKKRGAAERGKR